MNYAIVVALLIALIPPVALLLAVLYDHTSSQDLRYAISFAARCVVLAVARTPEPDQGRNV